MSDDLTKNYKILIVDDEPELRKSIIRGLQLEDFESIVEANNGQEAIEILGQEKFDLIISDVKMPQVHGIALLHHVRRKLGDLPFLMMTGFSDVMETTEALEIGATGFLLKPFSVDDIIAEIRRVQGEGHDKGFKFDINDETEEEEDIYCPIPIKEFISGNKANFPIYLKLNIGKFIKIANRAEDLDKERVDSLEKKGVLYFYAEKSDFKRFALDSHQILLSQAEALKTSKKEKELLLRRSGDLLANYSFSIGVDEVVYNATLTNLKQSLSVISDREDIFKVLNDLSENEEDIYCHSMGVCLIALMLARKIGIESSLNIYKICVSSFFHDIGLGKIPERVYRKSHFSMFEDELKLYESHPRLSAEELLKISDVTSDIGEIIIQHHEYWNGTGFPSELKGDRIHPLARIISIADQFCYHIIGGFGFDKEASPRDALRKLEDDGEKFEPKLLEALKEIYNC